MKEYQKLCIDIKRHHFRLVLISGAQRSGSRFTAKCIAKELDYKYVDETDFGIEDDNRFRDLCKSLKLQAVIHCPAMSHLLHNMGKELGVGVVFCRRNFDDIIASQKRISWRSEPDEKRKYRGIATDYTLNNNPICKVKAEIWNTFQKKIIPHAFESEYDWWKEHPDFLPKDKRANFHPSQTS